MSGRFRDVLHYMMLYILAISKLVAGQILTWDSAHRWQLYSTASLRDQAANNMAQYPTQTYYRDTVLYTINADLTVCFKI